MEVHLTREQEAQLMQLAMDAGTDAEHLVKDLILCMLGAKAHLDAAKTELPIWHLGATDRFHRRDIYNNSDVH